MSWHYKDLSGLTFTCLYLFWLEKYAWYFLLDLDRGVPISVLVGVIIPE